MSTEQHLSITDPDGDTVEVRAGRDATPWGPFGPPEGHVGVTIESPGYTGLTVWLTPENLRDMADAAEEALR